jgi:GT2 family glycosyltransferase
VANDIRLSVVVPTCGRPDLLNRCLAALTEQTLDPSTYEIIVVDDRPSRRTEDIVGNWAARVANKGLDVRYFPNFGTHGPAAARNRGWQEACGDIIAFTDDDTVPDKEWLKQGADAFDGDVDVVWGRIEMPLSSQPTDYERDAQRLASAEFVTANCFCLKSVLQYLRGFDERFRYAWREDSDFYFRLLDSGAAVAHVPEALVVHPVRPAKWGVSITQQKKILFDALLYKKHPQWYREKIRATPRWDYYLIVVMLIVAVFAFVTGDEKSGVLAGCIWLFMTLRFCRQRLAGTAKTVAHVVEMIVTSVLIPPLAVFWRLVGALRFRVAFV